MTIPKFKKRLMAPITKTENQVIQPSSKMYMTRPINGITNELGLTITKLKKQNSLTIGN